MNDENAISPVIATILLVAITVILSAVVFLMVNKLGGETELPLMLGVAKDGDNYIITQVPDETLTYSDLDYSGCNTVKRGNLVLTASDNVLAGDKFVDCDSPLVITHDGKLIYSGD